MITIDRPTTVIDQLPSIDLDELVARAALLTRLDRKYVLTTGQLDEMLRALPSGVQALEIDGRRTFDYHSVYYDTPDLVSYLAAARPRRRRFKVRLRRYLDSGEQCWEIKTRGPRGATVKHRHACPGDDPEDQLPEALSAAGLTDVSASELAPVLTTAYARRTLYLARSDSRVTVDTDLSWSTPDGCTGYQPELVVVETKSAGRAGDVDRLLWSLGHRPRSVSKYGTGLAALRPELPANKWRPVLKRHFANP